ncbi:hypothetical protein V1527DRAFT_100559 [Lipomyces starkeyi]
MSHIFRAVVFAGYIPKSRMAPIVMALLYLLGMASAYNHGRLCVSAVYHKYDIYYNGDFVPVREESGLLVYQDGVDITNVAGYQMTDDLTGSAKVQTVFKVGAHSCTLYGNWKSGNYNPPRVPSISKIKCAGSDRIWSITSSDADYSKFIEFSNEPGEGEYQYRNAFTVFGRYCGSY